MTRLSWLLLACLLLAPCVVKVVAFKPSLLPTTPHWHIVGGNDKNKIQYYTTKTGPTPTLAAASSSRLFVQPTRHYPQQDDDDDDDNNKNKQSSSNNNNKNNNNKLSLLVSTILRNGLDTCASAGIPNARTAGVWGKIQKIHDPITYIVLAAAAGFRWEWCFRNPYYWFAVGFCIKWYRARYVFKIPVWDRQPNWNNIITSKEQEKDLKAFTCKKCGSTLFIAKTREFFFEGNTGIGGLGCFSCGAKGKDNFVMDRDRIVEDVADMDDYFEYERPLDFVSRAERRKLLKEAAGDEEKANQLLLERQTGDQAQGGGEGEGGEGTTATVDAETVAHAETQEETDTEEASSTDGEGSPKLEAEEESVDSAEDQRAAETTSPAVNDSAASSPSSSESLNGTPPAADEKESSPAPEPPKAEKKKKKKKDKPKPPPAPVSDEDMLDALDMDAL